jgi:gliding motility-associated-like protein
VNPIPVTAVNSPIICPGGTATLTGTGAASYVWSTGAVTNPINVTPAATTSYTVTGTSLGCTSSAVATVTVGASVSISVNTPTICNGSTATLTASGASTYLWNTGSTANPLNVTPATTTTYTVTGTAVGGCTGTATATVTVNPLPVTAVTSATVCDGVTATMTASGATTYAWSAGATSTGVTTADATPSTTTTYTVTGTSLGCTSTAVSTITVNPIPVTTVNSPSICPATTANLTAGGATTYTWSAGATSTGVNTATATPAATTTYTVTGTSLGCTSTAVATVTVNAALVVNAGVDDSVCFGGSITLGVTPNGAGYSYAWTPAASLSAGGTIFNPVASPTATTTYSVTVTDPSGCTGTDNVTIYADPQITMAIAAIDVTCNGACNGQTIVIPAGGTPSYSYNWTSGCTGASCSSLCPGTYTVTVTDSWGCTATANTTVVEPTLLTASTTSTTPASCNGVCDGTATAAGAGGTVGAGYAYSWNTVPAQTTAAATGLCAGTYTCTVTDANGCTATSTATITEPTLVVTAPITAVTICNGGTTTLTASASGGNTGGYTYTWLPAGTGATASVTVSPAATTTYTVNAVDVLHACPAAPVTVTVTVNPPLAVVANGATSICPGASAVISAVASLGNGGSYTYTWAPAGTGTGASATVSPAATTTYTVTANDGCSPAVTATVTVTILPLPVVNFASDVAAGCEPLCVNFTDNSTVTGGAISTWAWTFDGITDNTANPAHCFANPGSYNVGLTVTSSLGGCSSTSTITNMITVYPNPVASFTAPTSVSIINPVVTFTDASTNAASWNWNFGDPAAGIDSVSNVQNPVHTFSIEGTYCATLTVTSANGCISSTSNCVVVDPEFTFYIPNAFSPNGDGINDEFFGKGEYIIDYEMSIFDRWGNLIFFADDINKHWDGKANHGAQMAQQDVYVYVVKIKDHKNVKHKYVGTVTIVK